ncbi:MAG: hypothetical protein ACFFB5_20080 [Promethearchaeota archaeon]
MFTFLYKRIAFVIIILVTAFAFVAGYAQNDIRTKADESRTQAVGHQQNVERISDRIAIMSNLDGFQSLRALDYFTEGALIALEYSVVADTLTPDEDLIYQLNFMAAMVTGNGLIQSSVAGVMHFDFLEDSNMDYYEIATIEKNGYEYMISRDQWEIYTPIYSVPKEQYYLNLGLESILADLDNLDDGWESLDPDAAFYQMDWDNIYSLYRGPLWEEVKNQLDMEDLADQYESIANRITIGVTITTVATILAAAMGSRLAERKADHHFSVVLSDLKSDPSLVEGEFDLLALLGLILAFILSLFGLSLPLSILLT